MKTILIFLTLILFIFLGLTIFWVVNLSFVTEFVPEGQPKPQATLKPEPDHTLYDLVIRNGRVINPETNFDQHGVNIGITGGRIAKITNYPIHGKQAINAEGLIVAPGFIDILSYDPNQVGVWNKIADGVTTNLGMHGSTTRPDFWYANFERQKPPLHFGASFLYTAAPVAWAYSTTSRMASKLVPGSSMSEYRR